MKMHIQTASRFFIRPRIRIYRAPLLIWIQWLGKSAFIERCAAIPEYERKDGA